MFRKGIISLILVSTFGCVSEQSPSTESLDSLANTLKDRWQITTNGIEWQVNDSHQDHLEFSGERVSGIIYYGSDQQGNLALNRKVVWPMLRTIPNDTHASLIHDFPLSVSPKISIDGNAIDNETLLNVQFNGMLALTSKIASGLRVTRVLAPSTKNPAIVEQLTYSNKGNQALDVVISDLQYQHLTEESKGVYGVYKIEAKSDKSGQFTLAPNESLVVNVTYIATKSGENNTVNVAQEIDNRAEYIDSLKTNLQLKTPDKTVNKMFEFAKLRAAESIFRTKGGLMHGPGGSRYYAAIWANDQAEYINPFFPFLGNANGNESAINSFEHFARFMNDDFEPIPSSIIAEGVDIWNGAGDRGDCAMIAYGASRFALANGDRAQGELLLPLIDWCIEFSYRKMSDQGVIASDSDELEGRFPAGDYNLSTNVLTYGALISSAHLHRELGQTAQAQTYESRAQQLRKSIEQYFGANVQGYDTYQYFEGNKKLRAWIALPFTMGIFERKQGTLKALFSDHLWNENGIYSEAGNKTFWDRATLYSFRGIFAAKETDTAMKYFKYYSRKRLLGEHVPYAVEAWPEGDQRHLSAESALYARVVTEGIFGIEPTGFKRFDVAPYLPTGWNNMCLNNIRAFKDNFSVCVTRIKPNTDQFEVTVDPSSGNKQVIAWDGQTPISISL